MATVLKELNSFPTLNHNWFVGNWSYREKLPVHNSEAKLTDHKEQFVFCIYNLLKINKHKHRSIDLFII